MVVLTVLPAVPMNPTETKKRRVKIMSELNGKYCQAVGFDCPHWLPGYCEIVGCCIHAELTESKEEQESEDNEE